MPSFLHEALLLLFRNRPALAPELVGEVLGVMLPHYTDVRLESSDLTEVAPTEYRADLVVLLDDHGAAVLAIIVEAQLARDEAKRFSWPVYVVTLRARLRCPVHLLVVCPDDAVARWCAQPIALGSPGSVLTPLVIGPTAVPLVTDVRVAAADPELAVLSALAHGKSLRGGEVGLAVILAAGGLDEERSKLYADMVFGALSEAARRALEAHMANGNYEYQSDFAKKYVAQGRAEGEAKGKAEGEAKGEAKGKASAILAVLEARGLVIASEVRARIVGCTDSAQLDAWVRKAVTVSAVVELFA